LDILSKRLFYEWLVDQRKACTACDSLQCKLRNPSIAFNGLYDTGEIGHWTDWQNSLDARILVIGQDWGDIRTLEKQRGECNVENSSTNRALMELIRIAGVEIDPDRIREKHPDLFFTNAVLCMKSDGGLAGKVKNAWFRNCVRSFLKPLIEVVQPRVAVTLGEKATRSLLREYGYPAIPFKQLVEQKSPIRLDENTVLFPVFHCGSLGRRNRSFELQKQDWRRIRSYLEEEAVLITR